MLKDEILNHKFNDGNYIKDYKKTLEILDALTMETVNKINGK